MRPFPICLVVLLLLCSPSLSAAQAESTCPEIVAAALQATAGACGALGRNQACYGNFTLQTEFQANIEPPQFDAVGDLVNVADIESLRLSSMSMDDHSWGVALMKIQANLPDTLPGQNVLFVLFGNVQIETAADPAGEPFTLALVAAQNANVRAAPSTQSAVVGGLSVGETVSADGRLADSSWIRIQTPDGSGWVSTTLLQGDEVDALPVVDSAGAMTNLPVFGPMQAFYLETGLGDAPCTEAPASGILIQTPQRQQVMLTVNEVALTFGSTAYLQAQPSGFMTVSVVEGAVSARAYGVEQWVPAGMYTRIPLDAQGIAAGAPEAPQPYDPTALAALPVSLLTEPITIPSPITATPEATDEASAIVTTDALPLAGSWTSTHIEFTASSGCGYRNTGGTGASFTSQLATSEDGAVLTTNGRAFADRTAPGVYSLRGLPYHGVNDLGKETITHTDTWYVLSSTRMREELTGSIPVDNCRTFHAFQWDYVGP